MNSKNFEFLCLVEVKIKGKYEYIEDKQNNLCEFKKLTER